MTRIRVLIADDHAILRAGVKTLIDAQPDMEVVGEAGDSAQALTRVKELAPNVVTLDLSMPGAGSLKIIQQLRSECPDTKILVLTMHDDISYARTALAAGCSGYIVKTTDLNEFLTAIRAVQAGKTYVDPHLKESMDASARADLRKFVQKRSSSETELSEREDQVLTMLAQGCSYQQISNTLYISVKTVETYRRRLSQKLGLRTRADLVRFALETGRIGPSRVEVPKKDEPM
jgi:two-component system response regulator NreC